MQRDFIKGVKAHNLQRSVKQCRQFEFFLQDGNEHVDANRDPDLSCYRIGPGAIKVFHPAVQAIKNVVLRIISCDLGQAGERSSLPRKKRTRVLRFSKQEMPRALAMMRAICELMPSEAALVMRCLR